MSYIGALGNNTDDNNYNFNFNDLNIRIVDVDTSNYARFLDYNSSNYTDVIGLNSSNYTDVIGLNSSNYTDYVGLNSSNYTDVISYNSSNYTDYVGINSSNYTERIEEELSDRIGYPASLIPLRLTSGVYIPIKAQEVEIATVGEVVAAHTIAIGTIEEQIVSMVGVGGIIGFITGGTLGAAITTANNAETKANQAISTANTAKTTAETATITAEEGQTIAEDAQTKANTALSIWNKGTVFAGDANNSAYDYTNNIYHLQTGNVGIGVTNDTELTHKLVVNGNSKLNGSLNIENLNANTFLRFYNYSDATTIKQSGFIYLSDYTEVFAMDTASLPIELRIGTYPIIQVYSNKVDITKNLNVSGDITFTGNLYDANGIFTSGGGGSGGTTYDDTNRLNYEFLKEPTGEGEAIVNIQEPIIQPTNIQEPTIELFILEPTSSPSVAKTTINGDYKYMSFIINTTPNLVYDFISKNTFADWKNYADTIPNATYDLTDYDSGADGLYKINDPVGFFQIILPSTHTRLSITWGNAYNNPSGQPNAITRLIINGVVVDSISNIIQTKVYNYNYTGTPTVRVSEEYSLMTANMILNLQNPTPNTYSINFPEQTECDILVIGGGGGGGHDRAGGGGAGACLVYKNYVMNGNYTANVGKGGLNVSGGNGENGFDSSISNAGGDIFLTKGGGGGGAITTTGVSGGCGGGAGSQGNYQGGTTVNTNKILGVNTAPSFNNNYIIYGNIGGRNTTGWTGGNLGAMDGAGGGGIGQGGTSSGSLNAVDSQFNPNNPGKGGDGRYFATINGIDYNFKNYFGIVGVQDGSTGNFFIGGGGGGGDLNTGTGGTGGKGGGGLGGDDANGGNAIANTGGGGGGAGGGNKTGGVGGSGIVIIRYKYTKAGTLQPITINSDYKYFTFPRLDNTLNSTTLYNMNFQENTEVELLILSNTRFKVPASVVIIPAGKINILVGGSGSNSSFGSISTAGETTPYNSYNSAITGTTISYNQAIVIVRYKYTRPIIQPIIIDNHYKYISFPNYGTNQTTYSLNFQENTEVQLLLLDGLKYIEEAPFTTSGNTTINVGNPSTYDTLTTNTNSTFYNFSTGHLSTITGTSTGYNTPIVIVRYKYTKTIITQVNTYGFLKYNNDNVWEVSNEIETIINNLITRIQTLESA